MSKNLTKEEILSTLLEQGCTAFKEMTKEAVETNGGFNSIASLIMVDDKHHGVASTAIPGDRETMHRVVRAATLSIPNIQGVIVSLLAAVIIENVDTGSAKNFKKYCDERTDKIREDIEAGNTPEGASESIMIFAETRTGYKKIITMPFRRVSKNDIIWGEEKVLTSDDAPIDVQLTGAFDESIVIRPGEIDIQKVYDNDDDDDDDDDDDEGWKFNDK